MKSIGLFKAMALTWKADKMVLNSLDEKYRIVVILYYVQGFKTREIAEILQINL